MVETLRARETKMLTLEVFATLGGVAGVIFLSY